jgi:alginate O-acetyltransferase complex protein AlgI
VLFNSIEFLLFLPTVFVLYWFVFNKNLKVQNSLILISSYVFYGWWNYRFLSLIFLSTIVDYTVGLNIPKQNSEKKQKLLLWCSVLFNLSVLGFFKYYNFFVDSWIDLFSSVGYEIKSVWTLNIILPVGISFYTFQTMSYTIDIYRNKLEPTKDFISFASFVSFFPQLVAGPIERASNLLPQILNRREFQYEQGVQGLRLILWGMFKKVVIADSLAPRVDDIFGNYQDLGGGTLWLGAIYFAFQIYCDFSGYSDIAIGSSKLFGFELKSNFKFPYFSRNIGEFWRRWHISLSTWFRDYLYIPLGGSQKGKWNSIRNIFIIFLVSGFWHGANWTFIIWGLFHSILFLSSLKPIGNIQIQLLEKIHFYQPQKSFYKLELHLY